MTVGHRQDNFGVEWELPLQYVVEYIFPVKSKTENEGLGRFAQGKQELILPKTSVVGVAWLFGLVAASGRLVTLKSSHCGCSVVNQRNQ